MSILERTRNAIVKAISPVQNVPQSWPVGWFQQGMDKQQMPMSRNASVVEACVKAYAETIAQLPGRHYRIDDDGTKTYLTTSALSDVLHKPNGFQTRSDFMLNLVYSILYEGNGYIFGRGESARTIEEIYLLNPRETYARMERSTGSVFYEAGGEWAEFAMIDGRVLIPSRYVGHVRLHTPRDPLIGETPIASAMTSIMANNAITNHQAAFFSNMSRPSGALSTELQLSKEQMETLRKAWEEKSKGMNSGGVPILSSGLKWQQMSMSSQDAQMIDAWRMTVEDVSRVFRVPPPLINNMENSTLNNAETLMSFWLASGLGFMVDHIENAFASLFMLPKNQGVELDTDVLLRTDLKGRMDALGTGVTQGLLAPNEGRKRLNLPPVKGGDMPRVQQQMVPLDWEQPEPQAATPALPAPDEPDETDENADDTEENAVDEQTAALLPMLLKSAVREGFRNAA